MAGKSAGTERKPSFRIFRSVQNKLLVLMIALSLLPLIGMSAFSYWIGRRQIQESIRLSLGKMAQDTADKVDLTLRSRKEEIRSMATTYAFVRSRLDGTGDTDLTLLLNNYCLTYDAYDLLMVLDSDGNLVALNTVDRDENPLPAKQLSELVGTNISRFPEEHSMFLASVAGTSYHRDWYPSQLVERLYGYRARDESHRYNIAFSEPIRDPRSRKIVGVWINVLNWSYFQNILDSVEMDLLAQGFETGYGFLAAKDADTLIAHKNRMGRGRRGVDEKSPARSYYGTKLVSDHGSGSLHRAIREGLRDFDYAAQEGRNRICGLAPVDAVAFGWTVGVVIDESDFLRPIQALAFWLLGATVLFAALVVLFTFLIARGISVSLKTLIRSALKIAQGNFDERVPIRSSDEVGILATAFNEMAGALSLREKQLQDLNRNLESMVQDRTLELENSHEALKRAYLDLQNAQEQLVQTEKMASLGQLVAGIAHEIKNPLNFIYGNTGFLADYTQKMQGLVDVFDRLPSLSAEDRAEMRRLKDSIHYSFIQGDLKVLIDNFAEGARRINTIVTDLRTFSRMDADKITDVDIHASLELSLNLLRNQYKNRVAIHKEYGDIPRVQGYAGKLHQVFLNLLSNAIQAIEGNGEVWVRTRPVDGWVEVEIEDSGAGIPKENLKRIFEPFYTTKPVGQGTGLGLSISYGIIEQHQGRIIVASVPLKGSTFTIRLPVLQEKSA